MSFDNQYFNEMRGMYSNNEHVESSSWISWTALLKKDSKRTVGGSVGKHARRSPLPANKF